MANSLDPIPKTKSERISAMVRCTHPIWLGMKEFRIGPRYLLYLPFLTDHHHLRRRSEVCAGQLARLAFPKLIPRCLDPMHVLRFNQMRRQFIKLQCTGSYSLGQVCSHFLSCFSRFLSPSQSKLARTRLLGGWHCYCQSLSYFRPL